MITAKDLKLYSPCCITIAISSRSSDNMIFLNNKYVIKLWINKCSIICSFFHTMEYGNYCIFIFYMTGIWFWAGTTKCWYKWYMELGGWVFVFSFKNHTWHQYKYNSTYTNTSYIIYIWSCWHLLSIPDIISIRIIRIYNNF